MTKFKVGDRVIFKGAQSFNIEQGVHAWIIRRSPSLCSPKNAAEAWLDIETSTGVRFYNCSPEDMEHESLLIALSRLE